MCIPGCNRGPGGGAYAASFRTLCSAHGERDRRHGDPLQEAIRATELAPYIRTLRRRQKLRPDALAWTALENRWGRLAQTCRDTGKLFLSGEPMNRWEVEAAGEIVKVADQATAEAAWSVAVAMVMLREAEPRRFQSERAFRVQLGRRIRQLALSNRASFWHPGEGRFRMTYRDPSPRAAVLVGDMLAEVFGVAGMWLARQEQADTEAAAAERTAFYRALDDVAPMGAAP